MTLSYVYSPKRTSRKVAQTLEVRLSERLVVPVHVICYNRNLFQPRLVAFKKPMALIEWCEKNNIKEAINGGFSLHHSNKHLGEIWSSGVQYESIPFASPWNTVRGSMHISSSGKMKLAGRHHLPLLPPGDLLQAGPLLVHNGKILIKSGHDPEGFSESSQEMDDDWTQGRWPRAAIGADDKFIWGVATDGYNPKVTDGHFGLNLLELAQLMQKLGVKEALNLDGGSSATLVSKGRLVNLARAGRRNRYEVFPQGRPVLSAIIFDPI